MGPDTYRYKVTSCFVNYCWWSSRTLLELNGDSIGGRVELRFVNKVERLIGACRLVVG